MLARLLTVALLLGLAPSGSGLWAQTKADPARFKTIDGVNLQGSFYATSRRNPPTVLMLHALGEDSSKKGYGNLAEELSANGFAVLTFDFRGHGKSTSVEPLEFWVGNTMNTASFLKGRPGRDTIEFKEFSSAYYPSLINDIAAARAYLDRKNDAGGCNTSNLIVVAAEESATLAAGWINSEYYRYRTRPAMFPTMPPTRDKRSEGEGIIAGVWLSVSPKLGSRDINMLATMKIAAKDRGTPMVFIHSTGDERGTKFAEYCVKNLKDKDSKYTAAVPLAAGELKGADLISQPIAEQLRKYLENVVLEKGNEWTQKNYDDAQYHWVTGPNPFPAARQWLPAKPMGDINLLYNTYSQFIAFK